MSELQLIAKCAFGLEAVVSRELEALGFADRTVENGRVTFAADESGLCRANLRLRSAERVQLLIDEFDARDFDELFERTRSFAWSDLLPADAAFPVTARSTRSQLHHTPSVQSIVKKAIVESLRSRTKLERFPETGPLFRVEAAILQDKVTLAVDASGPGLHKRGYRTGIGPAPLKESLAAALVQLSYWKRGRPFIDPCCGSGTIVVEAALLGRNIAPGINRSFACEDWPLVGTERRQRAREEAADLVLEKPDEPLIGYDIDRRSLGLARQHAQAAGVADDVHFQQQPLSALASSRKFGCVVANPPYGERFGELHEAEALYAQMQQAFAPLDTWSIYVLTSHRQFEKLFARRADRRRKLYNGRIACTYYQYHGPRPPARS